MFVNAPPDSSKNLLSDINKFLFNKPEHNTLVTFNSEEERLDYSNRIMQRLNIDANEYSVLNIHKIGVYAPPSYVYEELLQWNGDSTCWPNHIAKVDRIENELANIRILPFGWKKYPFKMNNLFGIKLIPLFNLNAIEIKSQPDSYDFDNARYLLYKCSGGYPIGIFAMYVRSSLRELGEKGHAQLFFGVGFNFYGDKNWKNKRKLANKLWERVHNRVTANVLNRIKQLSEWRIAKMKNEIVEKGELHI
jgi:hypothetical protein